MSMMLTGTSPTAELYSQPSDYGGQSSTIKESDGGVYLEED